MRVSFEIPNEYLSTTKTFYEMVADMAKDGVNGKLEILSDKVEEPAIFDADERADIMNAINDTLDDMGYVAVGYDDTNGVWMDVFIQKQ